jgi:hypothetical protein
MKEGFILAAADEHYISLPAEMGQLVSIRQKESNTDLQVMTATEFEYMVPDPLYTGNPYIAVELGLSHVLKQPQNTIYAYSSDATADDEVTITGDVDGVETSGTITLNGITPVACTTYFNRIYKVSVDTAPAGVNTVTITDVTPTTLATIAAGATTGVITKQPAIQVSIVSSSASDTSSVGTVRIGGFDGDGVFLDESISMNGTTTATSTNYYNTVDRIAKSAVTTGIITVSTASPSRTLAKIAPTSIESEYIRLGLYPIPSTAINLFVRYKAIPRTMVADSDTFSPIPQDYGYIIRELTLARAWDYMHLPNRGDLCRRNAEQYIQIAIRDDARRISGDVVIGGSRGNPALARRFSYPKNVSEATT